MTPKLLIHGARQLLTLRASAGPRRGAEMSDLGLVEDGAVLIADGRIAALGPSRRIENMAEARDAREINATGRLIMPGFVDSHTSLISGPAMFDSGEAFSRGSEGFEPAMRFVRQASGRTLQLEAMKVIRAAARHGTTTLEAKSGFGLTEASELKVLRSLGKVNRQPVDIFPTLCARRVPPEFTTADDFIDWLCRDLLPRVEARKSATFSDVVIEGPDGFTPTQAARFLRAAAVRGLRPRMQTHRHHTSASIPLALELHSTSVDHLNYIDDGEIDYLARGDTIATLLPGATLTAAERPAPARRLIDRGVPLALATGFDHVTSPLISMQTVISIACRELRMSPAEAITAATINGAWALGCADRLGSLEFGKEADILVLNASDYRAIPHYLGTNLVAMNIKYGEIVFRQSEVKPLGG